MDFTQYKANKMKNILLLLMLITFSAFAQNPDYHRYGARTKFVQPDTLSTAQRTALNPKLGTLIYHKDTGVSQWEQWDGDSWEEFGGYGAVSSVNFKTGAVVINPDDLDDFSTLNKFVTEEEKELIATALQDAPSDGNEYVRKDGDWEVATGGGDNIYTTDGTLEGDRSINIGEYSLAVKDSLGMPLMNIANDGFGLTTYDGDFIRGLSSTYFESQSMIGIFNSNMDNGKNATINIISADSTTIALSAERFQFDVQGTTPATGDVLTLQSDGTARFQAPGGGGGGTDDQTAAEVPFTPYSTIAATNVQDAIEEVLDEIPTSLAAANITVSPSIGGNTDAYAVMQANRTSIDSIQANMSSGVNTAFRPVTSTAGVFTEAFNDSQPNFELSLDEDVAITITSAVNGNFIIAEIYNDDVSENDFLVTLNGTNEDLIANIPFGERAFFTMITNSSNEITWLRSYPKGYKPVTVYNSATIAMDGDSVYDDMTADAATLTLSDCQIGETLQVYINRASMPTLAGTDLVFNQLPDTTIFEADTDMVITFIVTPLLDTGDMIIDYYLTKR